MSDMKMNARERLEFLLEENSFVELGSLVSARNTDYNLGAKKVDGDGVITGYGLLGDRMVYVYSQDAGMLGGSVGEMHAKKISSVYDMAMKTGAPVIGLIDCAGLRLQEANDALQAFGRIFHKQAQASGRIPQITAICGMCGGGSAVMSAMSDFTLMTREDSALFVNSPNALEGNIESKLNTGSGSYQAETAGNVDFLCDNEKEMLLKIRSLISYLPSDHEADDAYVECRDDLNRVIGALNDSVYDARFILSSIADEEAFLETKADYAPEMMTGFLRLDGETIGAVANTDPVLTAAGLTKAARFVRFCDAFSIPLLTLTNVEGMKASVEEENNLARAMARFTAELSGSTVPRVNLIAGKAFGTAGVVMNSKALGADFVLAWPDASIGMMDAGKAVRIIYAEEISKGSDQLGLIREKTAEYDELQSSALAAARRGYVDDIIEPDASRKRLIAAYEMLFGKKQNITEKKHPAI